MTRIIDIEKPLDLLSVGDANMDIWMKVPHHPDLAGSGERGMGVRGSSYYIGTGGVAANVAMGTARLGHSTGFVGAIGKDDMGDRFQTVLRSGGVDIEHIYTMNDEATSLACIFEPDEGEFVFYVYPGSRHIPREHLPEEYLASAKVLFLPGHMLTQDEVTCKTLLEAVQTARRNNTIIALDPSKYWLNPSLEAYVFDVIAMADLILPNRSEAELLTGCTDPAAAARDLRKKGANHVVITLGDEGCIVASEDGITKCPGYRTEVKSALGAGDAFTSGFLHGILLGRSISDCARFANASAALKMRSAGPQEGMPSIDEVEQFLSEQTS